MSNDITRQHQLNTWLRDCFKNTSFSLLPLKSDASFRQYWRINTPDASYVLMDAPPDKESIEPFIKTTQKLASVGVNVPHLFYKNHDIGALVLSDFGDILYANALQKTNARTLYKKAIDTLVAIQSINQLDDLPHFDEAHIKMELSLFDEWFLKRHLGIKETAHQAAYDYLIDTIVNQPQVAIHRDYHSRNLMLTGNSVPGILDHQDMMVGPLSYDMVSLLKDCYISWGPDLVNELIEYYLSKTGYGFDEFNTWFHITGVQRHLKAIGIFARLNYLYDKPDYLKYIPLPLKYVQDVTDKNNELSDIYKLVKKLS